MRHYLRSIAYSAFFVVVLVVGVLVMSNQIIYAATAEFQDLSRLYPTPLGSGSYFDLSALADWSDPENVSNSAGPSILPWLAVDSFGTVHAVWLQDNCAGVNCDDVVYASKEAGQPWTTPVLLWDSSTQAVANPLVEVDSTGRIYACWTAKVPDRRVICTIKPFGGSWLQTEEISSDIAEISHYGYAIDVDGSDNMYVAITSGGNCSSAPCNIWIASKAPAGNWQVEKVAGKSRNFVSTPYVSAGPDNVVHMVWNDCQSISPSQRACKLLYSSKSGMNGWTAAFDVAGTTSASLEPLILADDQGGVTVIWLDIGVGGATDAFYRYWSPQIQDWFAKANLSNSSTTTSAISVVQTNGTSLLASWTESDGSTISAEIGLSDGIAGPHLGIPGAAHQGVGNPSLDVDNGGGVHFAWSSGWTGTQQIYYSRWTHSVVTPTSDIEVAWYENDNITIVNGDVTPSSFDGTDFGEVDVSASGVTHSFRIRNVGTADLALMGDTVVGNSGCSDFHVVAQPVSPIVPGGSSYFSVKFRPFVSGVCTATLLIYSNDPDENPFSFSIRGMGFAPPTISSIVLHNNLPDMYPCGPTKPFHFSPDPPLADYDIMFTISDPDRVESVYLVIDGEPQSSRSLSSLKTDERGVYSWHFKAIDVLKEAVKLFSLIAEFAFGGVSGGIVHGIGMVFTPEYLLQHDIDVQYGVFHGITLVDKTGKEHFFAHEEPLMSIHNITLKPYAFACDNGVPLCYVSRCDLTLAVGMSPVDLVVADETGKVAGSISNNLATAIPNAYYAGSEEEDEYLVVYSAPFGSKFDVSVVGTADGTYDLLCANLASASGVPTGYLVSGASTSPERLDKYGLEVVFARLYLPDVRR